MFFIRLYRSIVFGYFLYEKYVVIFISSGSKVLSFVVRGKTTMESGAFSEKPNLLTESILRCWWCCCSLRLMKLTMFPLLLLIFNFIIQFNCKTIQEVLNIFSWNISKISFRYVLFDDTDNVSIISEHLLTRLAFDVNKNHRKRMKQCITNWRRNVVESHCEYRWREKKFISSTCLSLFWLATTCAQ